MCSPFMSLQSNEGTYKTNLTLTEKRGTNEEQKNIFKGNVLCGFRMRLISSIAVNYPAGSESPLTRSQLLMQELREQTLLFGRRTKTDE